MTLDPETRQFGSPVRKHLIMVIKLAPAATCCVPTRKATVYEEYKTKLVNPAERPASHPLLTELFCPSTTNDSYLSRDAFCAHRLATVLIPETVSVAMAPACEKDSPARVLCFHTKQLMTIMAITMNGTKHNMMNASHALRRNATVKQPAAVKALAKVSAI